MLVGFVLGFNKCRSIWSFMPISSATGCEWRNDEASNLEWQM